MGIVLVPANELPIIDYGTAPEIFAAGLARVDHMGSVSRFALYTIKTVFADGGAAQVREVVYNVILPTDAIGPAVEMTLATFGTALLVPAAGYVARRLLS